MSTNSGSDTTGNTGWMIAAAAAGGLILCSWIGWGTVLDFFLRALLALAIGAVIGFGIAAAGSKKSDERSGYWTGAGVSVAVACLAWFLIPDRSVESGSHSPAGAQRQNLTAEQLRAQRTLQYWMELGGSTATGGRRAQNVQEGIAFVRAAARIIERLPTVDVDPDAIRCGVAMRQWLLALAENAERQNSPAIFLEAFIRGYMGDPFGTFFDATQADAAIQQQQNQLEQQIATTRAMLSSRYGIEFPLLWSN